MSISIISSGFTPSSDYANSIAHSVTASAGDIIFITLGYKDESSAVFSAPTWNSQTATPCGVRYNQNGLFLHDFYIRVASSATAKLNPTAEWTTNGNANVTLSAANGTITILQAGEYSLNFYITFNTASIASSAIYNFHYAVNGVHSTRRALVKKVSNGIDMLHCSASGIAVFEQNDVISMYVGGDATSSATAITPIEAGFNCILIQPEL